MLVEAGERVGLPGLMRPTGSRAVIDRMAEAIIHDPRERPSLPKGFAPPMLSEVVLHLRPVEPDRGDPRDADASFPATARRDTSSRSSTRRRRPSPIPAASNSPSRKPAQMITAGRAENWRADYEARLKRHREELRAEAKRLAWSFTIHRTDRPANELLLALHGRIGEGNEAAVSNRRPRGGLQLGRPA